MLRLMTELDAVNRMLLTINERPVDSLEDSGVDEAAIARDTLMETSRAVQSMGWHFNTRNGVVLTPTQPQQEIILPPNCLLADSSRCSQYINVVQNGNQLFNADDNTFKFLSPITVDMILFLPFEKLIQPARDYIAIKAARVFQQRTMGSQTIEHYTQQAEMEALVVLKRAEMNNGDYNIINQNSISRYPTRRDRYI